jgi:hypothetical protein
MLYREKLPRYWFYYRSHSNIWYVWDTDGSYSPHWVRLEPNLHELYVNAQLQISNELEFVVITGLSFKRPYWKRSNKWKTDNYADIWYTRGR